MKRLAVILGMVLGLIGSSVSAAELESPADGAIVSGIGFISGWKCDAGHITVRLNGGGHVPLATEQPRADTRLACGTLTNGFITQVNWNFLGAGTHTAVAYDDGVEFARSTFTVGTADAEFLRGVEAEVVVPDFPAPGEVGRFVWNESTQHLELAEIGGADLLPPVEECEETTCPVCEVCRECPPVQPCEVCQECPPEEETPDPYPLAPYLGLWDITMEITHGCPASLGTGYFRVTITNEGTFSVVVRFAEGATAVPRYEITAKVSPGGVVERALGLPSVYGATLNGQLYATGSGSGTWYDGDSRRGCRGVWQATRR